MSHDFTTENCRGISKEESEKYFPKMPQTIIRDVVLVNILAYLLLLFFRLKIMRIYCF